MIYLRICLPLSAEPCAHLGDLPIHAVLEIIQLHIRHIFQTFCNIIRLKMIEYMPEHPRKCGLRPFQIHDLFPGHILPELILFHGIGFGIHHLCIKQ